MRDNERCEFAGALPPARQRVDVPLDFSPRSVAGIPEERIDDPLDHRCRIRRRRDARRPLHDLDHLRRRRPAPGQEVAKPELGAAVGEMDASTESPCVTAVQRPTLGWQPIEPAVVIKAAQDEGEHGVVLLIGRWGPDQARRRTLSLKTSSRPVKSAK